MKKSLMVDPLVSPSGCNSRFPGKSINDLWLKSWEEYDIKSRFSLEGSISMQFESKQTSIAEQKFQNIM